MTGELVLRPFLISMKALEGGVATSLTLNRMDITPLEEVSVPGIPLPLGLFPLAFFFMVSLSPPPQTLVMVEDCGAYRLLCPILSDDIIVYALLQVSGIELRDTESVLVKHWPTASIGGRIVAAREARVEVLCAPRCGSSDGGDGEGAPSTGEDQATGAGVGLRPGR